MFLSWLRMTAGLFQSAERIGGTSAKPQETIMQPVPKPIVIERAQATSKF
jgi:hypothetical protein